MDKPVASLDVLADYLLNGYWIAPGNQTGNAYPPHHFDHLNVTYSLAGLAGPDAEGLRKLAVSALQMWSDVCGITFTESNFGPNLYFADNYSGETGGAFPIFEATPELHYVGSTITFSQPFITGNGTSLDSGMFSALVHEIGHSLGLGHLGPYNIGVTGSGDPVFANDTKQFSTMSYVGQSAFGGASDRTVFTPQMADILAVQSLYGAATTRPGDTIYGFDSNAGAVFDFDTYAVAPALTIYDSGGIDTLDCWLYDASQVIDLNPGAYSSVGGLKDNIGIWLLTTIENAIGGSGGDQIYGNGAANKLEGANGGDMLFGQGGADDLRGDEGIDWLFGGDQDDVLKGGGGADALHGGGGSDTASYSSSPAGVTAQLWFGEGIGGDAAGDTYLSIENLKGSLLDDVLAGDDDANRLDGDIGDDTLVGAGGADELIGGLGADTADYGASPAGVQIELATGTGRFGEAEGDTLSGVENVRGSSLDDVLTGDGAENRLEGRDGNDELKGAGGYDTLVGGGGHDVYDLTDVTYKAFATPSGTLFSAAVYDQVVEAQGGGTDTVHVLRAADGMHERTGYTLPDHVENGTVIGAADFDLDGNGLANALAGNSGENTLSGGGGRDRLNGEAGYDTLRGGADDDTYELFDVTHQLFQGPLGLFYFDDVYDVVVEAADQGIDTVHIRRAPVGPASYTLPDHVENANVFGAEDFAVTGNALANSLAGNAGVNRLSGGGDNDELKGAGGDDTLTGGPGADVFVYRTGDATDTVTDYDPAEGDRIDFRGVAGVNSFDDLVISQVGTSTIITLGSGLVLENFSAALLAPEQFLFNAPPVGVALSAAAVAENSAAGTLVGTLSATDADPGEVFGYALLDDAGGRFALDGAELVVAGALDYESATSHHIVVQVTDAGGNTRDQAFDIAVANVGETYRGTDGNDVIAIAAGSGVDTVEAGPGNDLITIGAGLGPVVVDSGLGNDVIVGNGQTIVSYANSAVGITHDTGSGGGFRQAVLKNLATGEVTPLQTRSGESDVVDSVSSDNPVFSPDGTKVAFQSTAALVPGIPGGTWNVFIKDLATGENALVSADADGARGNHNSLATDSRAAWSPDGTKVAFMSFASNLVAGDSNGLTDIFVKTVSGPDAGQIVRASEGTGGVQAQDSTLGVPGFLDGSYGPQFSPDGSLLLFWSSAENFAAGDTNGVADVFLRVLEGADAGATYLISRDAAGTIGNGQSLDASFSPDGESVVFRSNAANLGATTPASSPSIFVKDVSAVYDGEDPSVGALAKLPTFLGQGFWPSFSPDGSKVLYYNGQIFYLDLDTSTNVVVSSSSAGVNGNFISQLPAWSPDGTKVTFLSLANNLVPGDTNNAIDIFVKTVSGPDAGAIERVSVGEDGVQANANSVFPIFSTTDSNLVAFETDANNLFTTNSNGIDKYSGIAAVWGSAFDDRLLGRDGDETFRGNAGNDIIQANNPNLVPGIDEADYSNSPSGIVVNLTVLAQGNGFGSAKDGWGGTDILRFIENVRGSDHADVINVDDFANAVWGNAGDDAINAGGQNDAVDGGDGNDTLAGGAGDDALAGGPGADTFVYRSGDGTDTIADFNAAQGDVLDLRGVAGRHALSDLAIAQVGSDTVITLGSGIVLKNVEAQSLAPGQFLFSQPPTDISISNATVPSTAAPGTVVGTLAATDPDAGETFAFSLLDDAGGLFALDGNKLVTAWPLDRDFASSHAVTVRVTDATGNSYDESLVIGIGRSPEVDGDAAVPTGFFLKIEGLTGNSAQKDHVGEFEVRAYDWRVSEDASGQVQVSPLSLVLDGEAGAALMRYAATQQLGAVQLFGHAAGNAAPAVFELRLGGATVASLDDGKGGFDHMTLEFDRMALSTRDVDATGKAGAWQSFGFDVEAGVEIDPALVPAAPSGGAVGSAASAVDYFLRIEGLSGNSTHKDHGGDFDVWSYDLRVSADESGEVQVSPLTLVLEDEVGSALMRHAATQQLGAVQLFGRTADEGAPAVYELRLADATIVSLYDADGGFDRLSFEFDSMALSTREVDDNGTVGAWQRFGFDVEAGTEIDPALVPGIPMGGVPGSAASAVDYFLRIEGLTGNSAQKDHVGDFDVRSYDFSVVTDGSGGEHFLPLFVVLEDEVGSALARYAATQETLGAVQLFGRTAGSGAREVYELRLADATLVSLNDSGAGYHGLSFEFDRMALSTRDVDATGKAGAWQSFGFDVEAGVEIDPALVPAAPHGGVPGSAAAPAEFFLKIDGLAGGSTRDGHEGEFDVETYNLSLGVGDSGETHVPWLTLQIEDAAGSALVRSAATQEPLGAVRLSGFSGGDKGTEVYKLQLADVTISEAPLTGADQFGGNQAWLRLDFSQMTLATRTVDEQGKAGAWQEFTFADGTPDADWFAGRGGDDWLSGRGGDDTLRGDAGNDTLIGGPGDDILSGGPGADTFVYRTGDGTDTVLDFSAAEGDKLDLRGVVGVGNLSDLDMAQVGADTVITLGSGLVLKNVALESLAPEQFLFNHAPSGIRLGGAEVAENSAAGTVVGNLVADDADPGETFVFTLLDDAGGRFAIDGARLVVAGALDHEAAPEHAVAVRVTDSVGNTFDAAFAITVLDVNEAPTAIALSDHAVEENSAAGTLVGSLTGSDPDAGDALSFTLLDDAGGLFALVGADLVLAGALDHEAAASHGVTVRATDLGGLSFDQSFLILVADVNEAPTDIALSASTATENSPVGTVVGSLSGSDPDAGDVLSFALLDDAGGLFAVDGTDLVVAGALDYEQAQGHVVLVRVTDSGGLAYDEAFALQVLNVAGVTITGSQKADRIDGGQSVAGQPLPTGEEDVISGGGASDRIDALGGNDIVSGGDAADWLTGGAGDDVLTGGGAADRFLFEPGFGHDRVTDFTTRGGGHDFVEFDRAVFADFAAVLAASQQEGANVVITADADNSVTLEGVSLSDLHSSSFDFVL